MSAVFEKRDGREVIIKKADYNAIFFRKKESNFFTRLATKFKTAEIK